MKKLNRYILLSITSLILIFPFLIPISKAQEWTYDGADTEPIPGFFVYPSERYYYNFTGGGIDPETYMRFDIVKGNITDEFMGVSSFPGYPPFVNGTGIYGDLYMGNATSGQEVLNSADFQFVYWNETVGLLALGIIWIPVADNGEATAQSLEFALEATQNAIDVVPGIGRFEYNASYPNIYSIELWNSTNVYYKMNYTENGHLINSETFGVSNMGNITLISRPAQMSPQFSLTTESGSLTTSTTELKLIADITDADNNNNNVTDTDYLYHIYTGTGWTAWAPVTSVIDYDLGPVASGNYEITMEVKNMYGVTSDAITIQYREEILYNGADTEPIPGFFVYPSERYYYNFTAPGFIPPETYMRFDVVKGNFTDEFMGNSTYLDYPPLVGGSCIWGDIYMGNATSGQEVLNSADYQFVYWNETVGLISLGNFWIPVDEFGEATAQSFEFALEASQSGMDSIPGVGRFEHNASYPTIYSCELWNSTYNNAYYKMNFTENGHTLNAESFGIPNTGNLILISRPAQMSPQFSLTTESGLLTTNTTEIKLIADITDADNNNDKVIDTDYQYRIYNGTSWTTWAPVTSVIDYDLGVVADGNYELTMEVKNMYGVDSDVITIQYTAPTGNGDGDDAIPSYPIVVISLVSIFSVSLILLKHRKKLRF